MKEEEKRNKNLPSKKIKSAEFQPLSPNTPKDPTIRNLNSLLDIPLNITVRLGKTTMQVKDVLELGRGSIIELDKLAGEPVDLLVNGILMAKGEVVVVEEKFGIRILSILDKQKRLQSLQDF